MKRLAVLGAVSAAALVCGPALAGPTPASPVNISTSGSCAAGYPFEIVSVGNVFVCTRSIEPEFQVNFDGSPCPAGWVQAGVAGAMRVCANF